MPDNRTDELIEKFLDGSLSEPEQAELDTLAERNPEIAQRIAKAQALNQAMRVSAENWFGPSFAEGVSDALTLEDQLATARPDSFAPFFEVRVMRAIADEGKSTSGFFTTELSDMLSRMFPRIAVPAAAAAGFAMAANVSVAEVDTTLVDALFGLPTEQPAEISMLVWSAS